MSTLFQFIGDIIIAFAIFASIMGATWWALQQYIKQRKNELSAGISKAISEFIVKVNNEHYFTKQQIEENDFPQKNIEVLLKDLNLLIQDSIRKEADLSQLLALAKVKYLYLFSKEEQTKSFQYLAHSAYEDPYNESVIHDLEHNKEHRITLTKILFSHAEEDAKELFKTLKI